MTSNKTTLALAAGAIGVVFGDIGTSPLYATQAIFGSAGLHLAPSVSNVYGVVSMIIWAVTLMVSIKFVLFIMRLTNGGEGGIMALVALLRREVSEHKAATFFIFLGVVGVSLFYGDSAITPAISVLSAIEGTSTISPQFATYVLPITVVLIVALFWLQKYGTAVIGRLFGPVMIVWFAVIGLAGAREIVADPGVLAALNPRAAWVFALIHPLSAFIALGFVVLAVTGAEALYADVGHFGRGPIADAWFGLAYPALILCYLGEGVVLTHVKPGDLSPLFYMVPKALQVGFVLLATAATLIASQSVISGAFSLTKQLVHLGFLPRLTIRHTSTRRSGQVYVPLVNACLFACVAGLVLAFGTSVRLANAFGVAVSITLAADTVLYTAVMYYQHERVFRYMVPLLALFVTGDLLLVASTLVKVGHGGWVPVLLATAIGAVIETWRRGQQIVIAERKAHEGSLDTFMDQVHKRQLAIKRLPGTAVYVGHHPGYVPLALKAAIDDMHELQEHVVVVYVESTEAAHIVPQQRFSYKGGHFDDGIVELVMSYGYHDMIDIPRDLRLARLEGLSMSRDKPAYYISLTEIIVTRRHNMAVWRKRIYQFMARNAVSRPDFYHLPVERTFEVESLIKL